jgi:hypothetical protein
MSDTKQILAQGNVSTTLANVYSPSNGQLACVSNIRLCPSDNTTAYTVACYHAIPGDSTNRLLFNLELDAGDWVDDDTEYYLGMGDYISIVSSVEFVNYVIFGREEKTNSYNFGNNPFAK